MSRLIQLLIGREIARRRGVEDNASQMRIGAIAAAVPNPMLGLVVAKMASDRAVPTVVAKPAHGEKPREKPEKPDPPAEAAPPQQPVHAKAKA